MSCSSYSATKYVGGWRRSLNMTELARKSYLKILSRHSPGNTEEIHEYRQSGESVSHPEFQQGTSRIAARRFTALVYLKFASILCLHATSETNLSTMIAVFWDVGPCRYFVSRRFGGHDTINTCPGLLPAGPSLPRPFPSHLHWFPMWPLSLPFMFFYSWLYLTGTSLQLPAHAGSSLVDFLYPEDGGDTFLRNVG
jgi:hypothetical protein